MSLGSPFDLLNDLTWAQQEAVTHFEGPLLILAGAGSGKTRVITRRVAWLLQQGVRPSNVLAITFTNKAAKEMRERLDSLLTERQIRALTVGTFHATCARWLRTDGEEIGIEIAGLHERPPELLPCAAVRLRVDVALAERRAKCVEHRVVRGAQRGRRIVLHDGRRRGQPPARGIEELRRPWAHW